MDSANTTLAAGVTPEEREFIEKYGSDAARWAIGKVATNIFGDSIAAMLSGPLFSLIGIGGVDQAAAYQQAVMDQLRKIEGQLSAVQQAISEVKSAITVLGNLISGEALAARIQDLETEANVIRTHFALVTNDVVAMGTAQGPAAAVDLFGRLRMPNDTAVALAMRNINSILLTTSSINPGVLQRLATYLRDTMVTFAAKSDNYKSRPWADGTPDGIRVYMDTPVLLTTKLHNGALDAAVAVMPAIGELFKRVLAVQTQGLVFLSAAWKGGPQAPELTTQIQALVTQAGLMKGFHATAATLLGQTAIDNLRQYAVRPRLRFRPVYTSRDGSFPAPFDEAWVLWDELIEPSPLGGESNSQFSVVRNPWDAQQVNPLTWRVYRNGSCPSWTWVTDCGAPYYKLSRFEDRPLPPQFDAINALPVKIPIPAQQLLRETPRDWDPYARAE